MRKNFNVVNFFIDRNLRHGLGSRTAIYFKDEKITYCELAIKINRAGNAFKELGIKPKDKVILILDDTPDFIICFLSLLKIGAIAVLTNTFLKINDYKYVFIGECVSEFSTDEPILDFIAFMGENDVPYPVAFTEKFVYFMLGGALDGYMDKSQLKTKATVANSGDLYSEYYGHINKDFCPDRVKNKPADHNLIHKRTW